MALRWIEGFEGFGALTLGPLGTEIDKKYDDTNVTAPIARTGRGGGVAVELGITQASYLVKTFDNQTTWVIGYAFHTPTSFSATPRPMVTIFDGGPSGTPQMVLKLTNDGITVVRNAVLLDTVASLFSANTWYYIEFKVTIHGTTGAYEVRINQNNISSDSGINTSDTGNAYGDAVRFYATENSPWYDDIYILDGTGGENDDFLGEMKVEILLPTSDTITADWSLSTGADHYALVDENPSDEDTTYVYSTVSAEVDLYNYDDIGSAFQTIYGVQVNTQAKVSSAASIDMYTPVSSGSTVSNGTAVTVSDTNYKTFGRAIGLDPDTGALWLSGAVDAALFGVKIV